MNGLRALRAGLAAATALALAAGCGGERQSGEALQETAQAEPGGTAVVAELADISMPVTALFQTELDGNLAADVLNMELLRSGWRDGALVHQTADQSPMALARRYEYVGPDSSAVRFHMRSDAKWSDGRPVTAHDLVFTYNLIRDPALASPRQDYVEHLDSLVAQNDSTLTFHFDRRYPDMLTHASLPPMPKHVFEGTAPAELRSHPAVLNPAGGRLVTSGPWMIGEWAKGQRVVLVPNPHFTPRPHLDQLVYRVIPETTTRVVELQTGNIDFFKGVPTDQIPTLKANPNIRLERERQRAYDFIAYNPKEVEAFADPEIRRALSLAIDVPRLIQALQADEYATPAGGPYPPIFKLYDPERMAPIGHDVERARQILESRGWRDTDGDGIREKNGRPLRFTLVTNAGNARRADASQIIQQQWRQIGVDAQLRQLEFNVFLSNLLQHDYEAALGGWIAGLTPDYVANLYKTGGPQNVTRYSDPEVDALIERAQAQPTAAAAAPLWQQAAIEVAQDQPYTWLYYLDVVDGLRDRLRGTKIDTYGPYQNTWEWWIPRSQQRGAAAAAPADPAR